MTCPNKDYLRTGRWLRLLILVVLAPRPVVCSQGPASQDEEHYVKAAFVCQLIKFVDWPSSKPVTADGVLTIGLVGPNRFGKAWDLAKTRPMKGKTLEIKEFNILQPPSTNDPDQQAAWNTLVSRLRLCHVAFFTETPSQDIRPLLAALVPGCVLVLGECDGFLDKGGMIGILPNHEKLVFEVNHAAIKASGMEISSKVLRLASRVVDK